MTAKKKAVADAISLPLLVVTDEAKKAIEAIERPDKHDEHAAAVVDVNFRHPNFDLITLREVEIFQQPALDDQGFGDVPYSFGDDFGTLLDGEDLFKVNHTIQSPNREIQTPGAPRQLRKPKEKDDETRLDGGGNEIHVAIGPAIPIDQEDLELMEETEVEPQAQTGRENGEEVASAMTAKDDYVLPMEFNNQSGFFEDADFNLDARPDQGEAEPGPDQGEAGPGFCQGEAEPDVAQDALMSEADGGEVIDAGVQRDKPEARVLKSPRNKKVVTFDGNDLPARKKIKIDAKVKLDIDVIAHNLDNYEKLQIPPKTKLTQMRSDPMLKPLRSITSSALNQNWLEITRTIDRYSEHYIDIAEPEAREEASDVREAAFAADDKTQPPDFENIESMTTFAPDVTAMTIPEELEFDQGAGFFEDYQDQAVEIQPPPTIDASTLQVENESNRVAQAYLDKLISPETYQEDATIHDQLSVAMTTQVAEEVYVKFNPEDEKRKILLVLSSREASQLNFNNVLNPLSKREGAAAFCALLCLEAERKVTTKQDDFWGPIFVSMKT